MPSSPTTPNGRLPAERALFVGAVALGVALFWIAPRPPMGDIPQHAGQVALLHDLLVGTSSWRDLVRVNAFTPYLLGYGLATLLSFVMPVLTALKVVLTCAYVGFIAAAVALRKEHGGDARLDWLFLPGFFGFAFQLGFYTFLVAAPVGLAFVLVARRFAAAPTPARAASVVAAGLAVFFAHGLVFLFACGVGVGVLAVTRPRPSPLRLVLAPYVVLAAVAVAYFVHAKLADPLLGVPDAGPSVDWEWQHAWGWHRVPNFALYALASSIEDARLLAVAAFFLAIPWAIGARPNLRDRAALVPIAMVVAIWLLSPGFAMKTTYVYHRFAVFLLPAYALAFRAPEGPTSHASLRRVAHTALVLACCGVLLMRAERHRRFAAEAADFDAVPAAAAPGERALGIVLAPASPTMRNEWLYHSYALYYQSEKRGFVDFNFAYLLPQIVRFRVERTPTVRASPTSFDLRDVDVTQYRYVFVRDTRAAAVSLADDRCALPLVLASGAWSLYERGACR